MTQSAYAILADALGVPETSLMKLEREMEECVGKQGILTSVAEEFKARAELFLKELNAPDTSFSETRRAIFERIFAEERKFLAYLNAQGGASVFEKIAFLARRVVKARKGFFLKKTFAREILQKSEPKRLLAHLGYRSARELVEQEDVTAAFSALRFVESDEWMHGTFDKLYSGFAADDFEERDVEIIVLGEKWRAIGEKFVAKKHHNVSHLKEFGVIFINPVREEGAGKMLRDFTLLLHYLHEVRFYSELFKKYARDEDFAERLKSLLRGDVPEKRAVGKGEWLIVQRYLAKVNPNDSRLFLPHVNPESLHWANGEKDLIRFFKERDEADFSQWENSNWVGQMFKSTLASFDFVDNVMSLSSAAESSRNAFAPPPEKRKAKSSAGPSVLPALNEQNGSMKNGLAGWFTYHMREALWTKIFMEYAGGKEELERLIIDNFSSGIVRFA